jgi:hypothetical protein
MRTRNIGKPKPPPPPPEGITALPRQPTVEEIAEAMRILKALQEAGAPHDGGIQIGDGGFDGEHLMMAKLTTPVQIAPPGMLAWRGLQPNGRPLEPTIANQGWAAAVQVCIYDGNPADRYCVSCGVWLCDVQAPNGCRGACPHCGLYAVWINGTTPKGTFRAGGRRDT